MSSLYPHSILVIAAAVFINKDGSSATTPPAGLFDAHDLIKAHIGTGMGLSLRLLRHCIRVFD